MITIKQMLENISKGQASIAIRYIIDGLNSYFEENKHNFKLLHVAHEDGGTRFHVHVPSGSVRGKMYDVVLWFDTTTSIMATTQFKVFSNSPDFAFTFAYVYHKIDSLLYPELYDPKMINEDPVVRNPSHSKGFSKIVYAAMKYCTKQPIAVRVVEFKDIPKPEVASVNSVIR